MADDNAWKFEGGKFDTFFHGHPILKGNPHFKNTIYTPLFLELCEYQYLAYHVSIFLHERLLKCQKWAF